MEIFERVGGFSTFYVGFGERSKVVLSKKFNLEDFLLFFCFLTNTSKEIFKMASQKRLLEAKK